MPAVNPSSRTTKTHGGPPTRGCRGAPLRLRRMARRRGAPRLPCPMARPLAQRASRLSSKRRRCSAHSPMWHSSRTCVGGCGTNPIVRPPLWLSMRGLYGAVSHMYVDPRSHLPNVLQLGGPPCVSAGSAGDRRGAGRSAQEHHSKRMWRRCHGRAAGRCAGCSPRVLLCRLQRPLRSVLRVLRVLRVLHVMPPLCLWRRDVTSFAICRSFPRRPKVRRPKKGPRRPQKALQKALPRVRRS